MTGYKSNINTLRINMPIKYHFLDIKIHVQRQRMLRELHRASEFLVT